MLIEPEKRMDPFLEIDKESCKKILNSIKDVLIEKNKRYGNSALHPLNIFYKGDSTSSICIRIDDKLSRIKNSEELRKNDLYDLLGYCMLYMVSLDTTTCTFEEKVNHVLLMVENSYINVNWHEKKYLGCVSFAYSGFLKGERNSHIIDSLNGVCSDIKEHSRVDGGLVLRLIYFLIVYFIQNDIFDFSDLID